MSFNQLAKINFPDLSEYVWREEDFGLYQTYVENYVKELIASRLTAGILDGGVLSAGSGLTVNVSKGLALLSTGQLVAWDDQTVTLNAADPTNPRIDRMELAYTLVDNTDVVNTLGDTKTLDKLHTATATKHTGTAAGSPSAPALTSGRLSFGLISVPATATTLSASSFSQDQTVRSVPRAVDPNYGGPFTIANNQGSFVDIKDLKLDSSRIRGATVLVNIYRKTSGAEVIAQGFIHFGYRATAATWACEMDAALDDTGLEVQCTTAGQAQYKSSNIAGTGYTADIRWRILEIW